MAAVTPNINQARAMRVAVRRIEGFAKQFGEVHRTLARHAAFPLVLTPICSTKFGQTLSQKRLGQL
jgi:hypothetical protein